ncbi:MAG: hypothetical protein M0036_03880 [Desulfobacteraceae bacterium]|nr:hypothetical protein [Desulfobacteraceae bacterium]
MTQRIIIPLHEEEVAPRFDLSTEVLTVECGDDGQILKEKILILPGPSAERLCHLALTEKAHLIICGGIDQEVFDYLIWKRVQVIDDVIGPGALVLQRYLKGHLKAGDIVRP